MAIIKNNLYYELTSETPTKPVSAVKIQLDVLDGCTHRCEGCFVNRRNNGPTPSDLAQLSSFVTDITEQGILVDEILIGPTDFLSSTNLYDVLTDVNLLHLIAVNSPILAFVTTLKGGDLDQFCTYLDAHINLDTEIEIGIATSPTELMDICYSAMVKERLDYLSNKIKHDITYTFIINVHDVTYDYETLHRYVNEQFDTTFDMVPSIARSRSKPKILDKLKGLNANYNALPSGNRTNNIMVDHSHSGTNFKVINFKRGSWWLSPFLYENMAIYDDLFKINSLDEVHAKLEEQYTTDSECRTCVFLPSCAARFIPLLMQYLDTRSCICPKENMLNNLHAYNTPSAHMYEWDGYSVDADKQGYRKKFLVQDENSPELTKIRDIYHGTSKR